MVFTTMSKGGVKISRSPYTMYRIYLVTSQFGIHLQCVHLYSTRDLLTREAFKHSFGAFSLWFESERSHGKVSDVDLMTFATVLSILENTFDCC